MKDLRAIKKKKAYILDLISEGEHEMQDFKFRISDACKIARTISAFANNRGGHLLIGVKDNGVVAGVRNEEDIYVVEQAATLYCRPEQRVEFTAFSTGDTGVVIRATVARADERPVCARESDGRWRAYYRVADENIAAHPLMVRAWRYMADDRSAILRLDGPDGRIIDALSARGELRVDEAIVASGASRRTAEAAIVRLCALGMIDFAHRHDGFRLTKNED